MPLFYLRHLTGSKRTESANRHLARFLTCIAGASNAGGLLAIGQYTSHMSGIISAMADDLALGYVSLALRGLGAIGAFLAGAFLCTLMIRWARTHSLESEYALPLVLESMLLVLFGLTGHVYETSHLFIPIVMLLCFTMGLQNAMITKISDAVIRTTHLTGMVTDIGISLGRIASPHGEKTLALELTKLQLHSSLIALFFAGGFIGAIGFRRIGFLFTLPLAIVLLLMAAVPLVDDVRRYRNTTI